MRRGFVAVCACFTGFVALTQCTISDPNFKTLQSAAETNPSPNAIVGMWHDQDTFLYAEMKGSLLFKSDGTFINRVAADTIGREIYTEAQTWHYAGNGVWTVEMKGPWAGTKTDRYRISQGKLLRETMGGVGPVKKTYVRVN